MGHRSIGSYGVFPSPSAKSTSTISGLGQCRRVSCNRRSQDHFRSTTSNRLIASHEPPVIQAAFPRVNIVSWVTLKPSRVRMLGRSLVLSSSGRAAISETCHLSTMTVYRAPSRLAVWESLINRNLLRSSSLGPRCAFASTQAAMEDIENNRDLFEYTSGRWMYVLILYSVQR
jgi:hypothetical protein